MPRNVRNFWLELEVSGKRTRVATGPVAKEGGFDLTIKIRRNGEVHEAGYILGRADEHGALSVKWFPEGGSAVLLSESIR